MFYDIYLLWFWLALSFALGAWFGHRNEDGAPQDPDWWRQGWFYLSLKIWCGFVVLAFVHIPGGRLGQWIESAVLIYAAFILGCLAGGYYFRREREKEALAAAGGDAPGAVPEKAGAPPARAPKASASATVPTLAADPPRIAKVEGEEKHEGRRPVGFVSPRAGKADNLQRIKGIGPQNEKQLHKLGIWHFAQIAAWTPENVQWVGSYLSFAGRIEREQWIDQSAKLALGGTGQKG